MFNKLYIADYCIWLQKISEAVFRNFGSQLTKDCVLSITKESLDLDLVELEQLALSQEEEEEVESDTNDDTTTDSENS
eukprot:CAMPEP_0116018244 /NCGR_PEP_ID=MMETSP0321-20121206/8530_1 /TAXON_ID=163516 /ORGANISM="Leptocylindrus danicus var. danicus, Strain B650" /LENGTH=77 /DNA_ID=CAMNT_0003488595 /DNA_START=167 /DNA_END=396 /DNA_ORIENTATION=+